MILQRCILLLAISWAVSSANSAWAVDKVKVRETSTPLPGKVLSMKATEVVLEQGPLRKNIPVNTIESISFDEEPRQMQNVRQAIEKHDYEEALTTLKEINAAELARKEVKKDFDFYNCYAAGRLALAGSDEQKGLAGRALVTFERSNADSYHYLAVCETLGDLLAAMRRPEAAGYYGKLAEAPWPDYKMRANVLIARSMLTAGKSAEAMAKFDEVLNSTATGKEADAQKLAATLGKAQAQAAGGQTEPAIKAVEEVIAKAAPEERELHARAYNALGNCYVKAGKKKEALMAFLHVDLLYSGNKEQHAEALANLIPLWNDEKRPERAAAARNTLKDQYPSSPWTPK
jgi:tetratricopeptide (TPR) repeat protein